MSEFILQKLFRKCEDNKAILNLKKYELINLQDLLLICDVKKTIELKLLSHLLSWNGDSLYLETNHSDNELSYLANIWH